MIKYIFRSKADHKTKSVWLLTLFTHFILKCFKCYIIAGLNIVIYLFIIMITEGNHGYPSCSPKLYLLSLLLFNLHNFIYYLRNPDVCLWTFAGPRHSIVLRSTYVQSWFQYLVFYIWPEIEVNLQIKDTIWILKCSLVYL